MTGTDDVAGRAATLAPRCGQTVVLAVDGPSGSGKTTLSRNLAGRIGATILHLDDVFQGWHGLAAAPPVVATEVLAPIARGEPGRTARWEWGAERPGADIVIEPGGVLILDGCGSGSRVIRPQLSLLIWLDAPEDVRRARAMARDGYTVAAWWDIWAVQERDLFAAEGTRAAADVILDGRTIG